MRLARHGTPGAEPPLLSGADGVRRDSRPVVDDLTPGTLPTVLDGVDRAAPSVVGAPDDRVLIARRTVKTDCVVQFAVGIGRRRQTFEQA